MTAEGAADHRAIEQAVRTSYGRLVGYLSARTGDLAGAEDALADAVRIALERWPTDGIPHQPEAWLLTAARRRLMDQRRRGTVAAEAVPTLLAQMDERAMPSQFEIDERLSLMFVCAHPAIDPAICAPLMMQVVLGLNAARIGAAYLVPAATMGQRLTRAKTKIRETRIRFAIPDQQEPRPRLKAVLQALYGAYSVGWDEASGSDTRRVGLAEEAIDLAQILAHLMPNEAEVLGLCALMLHCEARKGARRSADGAYIPLDQQDVRLWSVERIQLAEDYLQRAFALQSLGRFQIEAAIQSAHNGRAFLGHVDRAAVAQLYRGLNDIEPTIGAHVGLAAALGEAGDVMDGLSLLEQLPDLAFTYQPFWAVKARLLALNHQITDARDCYIKAIDRCADDGLARFLEAQLNLLTER